MLLLDPLLYLLLLQKYRCTTNQNSIKELNLLEKNQVGILELKKSGRTGDQGLIREEQVKDKNFKLSLSKLKTKQNERNKRIFILRI